MRLIAVGDIHGQYEMLVQLMEEVRPTNDDQFVYLGDYIDRGPDSKKVIEFLIEFQQRFHKTVFLRGNHEQMVLDARDEVAGLSGWTRLRDISPKYIVESYASDERTAYLNGGFYLLQSYQIDSYCELPTDHIDFMMATELVYVQEKFLFVHAAFCEDRKIEDQDMHYLLWERSAPPGVKWTHVVGHHPTTDQQPLFVPGKITLDTGAGYGKRLTACDVLTKQIWQAG